jgi:hypothetical protein
MSISLDKIYPWGREFAEYVKLFALDEDDLRKNILGCGDGPAAFNSTLTQRGGNVVSIDPLYRFTVDEISKRIEESCDVVISRMMQSLNEFVWTTIPSPEELVRIRKRAMRDFISDYSEGKKEGRYIAEELPSLSFNDGTFGLALCSHLLFYYADHLNTDFHMRSLRELCRVAPEVRVFPIIELGSTHRSRHFDAIVSNLLNEGYECEIVAVSYEVLKGGHEMLRVRPPKTGGSLRPSAASLL